MGESRIDRSLAEGSAIEELPRRALPAYQPSNAPLILFASSSAWWYGVLVANTICQSFGLGLDAVDQW